MLLLRGVECEIQALEVKEQYRWSLWAEAGEVLRLVVDSVGACTRSARGLVEGWYLSDPGAL